ncbi:MAG: DUF262 domain-containing protein [Sulfurimonas sp.]|nr:DUF262 domain-containing protein [Sulfurimonas sp.]
MLKTKKTNFYQIFLKGNFIIPDYQRGYVWEENELNDFYNDIKNIVELKKFKTAHFLGNILLKKRNTSYEIIDGQQRFVTIILFIKAFEKVYSIYKPELRKRYIPKIFENNLTVNDGDNIFDSIIYNTFNESSEIRDKSSEKIKKAYLYFIDKIDNNGQPLFKKTINTDESLYRVLMRLFFIEIEIDSEVNPYLIFETLNARGVELNISDLVKSHLIEKSSNSQHTNREWNRITNGIETDFEKIFQFFYNTRHNKKRLLKDITVSISNPDTVNNFLQKLSEYTTTYKKFSDLSQTYSIQEVQTYISYLNHLGNDFFKILAIPAQNKFSDSEFLKLLKLCEVFIFRYIVVTKKDERVLVNNFYNVARKINNDEVTTANEVYNLIHKEIFVDDEEFENAFSYVKFIYAKRAPNNYHNKTKLVKYTLYRLENYLRGDLQLSLVATGTNDVSIEHIENESSTSIADEHKYRLGNYALMKESDNNEMGRRSMTFTDKRTSPFYENSQYLTLIGGIKNNNTLSHAKSPTVMNEENIKRRQRQMAKIAVDLWSLHAGQFALDSI